MKLERLNLMLDIRYICFKSSRTTTSATTNSIGSPSIVRHKDVLDIRLANIPPCIGRLNVIIKKVVSEIGEAAVVDPGKIIIRHHR